MTNAFGVCQSGYIENSKGQMNKMVVELLFTHDIKPPYTNVDQWNFKKRKMSYNIKYPIVIFAGYQKEKVNYMNNRNALTFMKVEEGIEWIGHRLCSIICVMSWIDGQRCKRRCKWMGTKKIRRKLVIRHWFWSGCLDTCLERNLRLQKKMTKT
jgi:hypothetical protein